MNICKVVFYYIGILTVSIVFVKMLYELVTKKYKKKLIMDDILLHCRNNFSGICVFTIGISGLKDLPFVLKNQYPHAIGQIVEVNKTSHGDFSVIIEDEITKEKIDIGFIHKSLKEGEKVEVYYLPHLKIGSVYKIQQ